MPNLNRSTAEQIAGLLHEIRSPSAPLAKLHELVAVMRPATPEEIALGTLNYSQGLLIAARSVAELERDAAQVLAERDASGPLQ